MTPLLVAVGAAIGAMLRFLAGRVADDRFPAGTLAVNLIGSALLGFLIGAEVGAHWSALIGFGFCGSLTTYSTFALQTLTLTGRIRWVYLGLSIAGSLAAAALGYGIGRL